MDLQHRSGLNLIGTSSHASIEKEHMFDKVVTPSDVGKLNRLVIPKQYAEKYFPFDSFTNEKEGLLLTFEDREGKSWRFRYSYWNSSQSYVMTKGWSPFVKDKKLDAGDVVSFKRGASETTRDRLFIDWQHRPSSSLHGGGLHDGRMLSREQYYRSFGAPQLLYRHVGEQQLDYNTVNNGYMPVGGTGRGDPNAVYFRPSTGSVGTTAVRSPIVFRSVPLVQAAKKRLRLFGVNMDCPIMTDQSDDHHHHIHLSALPSKPLNNIGEFSHQLPLQQYEELRPMSSNSWPSSTMSLDINFQNLR